MRLAGNGRRDAASADTTQDFKTVYCPHGVGGGACAHPSSVKTTNRNNNKYDPGSQDGGAEQAGWPEQNRQINAKPCGSWLASDEAITSNIVGE